MDEALLSSSPAGHGYLVKMLVALEPHGIFGSNFAHLLSPLFFKKASGILQSPPSFRPPVTLAPPKPLDKIQPNLVCELLT